MIDYADDHAAPDLAQRALGFADQLQAGNLNDEQLALLDYFRANAWACLYAITRSDLERKALRILKLARSALIYLSLGMHREERQRAAKASKDTFKMPMILDVIPDDWKR